jgi:hypothetical protein
MARHNLHSFTLSGGASKIISGIGRGRKSAYASKAIIWFSKPREVIQSWGADSRANVHVVNMADQIMSHESLMKQFNRVCKENAKLREELEKNESFISRMTKFFKN